MKKFLPLIALVILMGYIGCGGENHPPVINDITFNQTDIYPQDNVICTVDATDEDEDPLTFTWSATGGSFSSTTGETVTWTAPSDTGDYTITVEAKDEGDATDTYSETVTVKSLQGSIYEENLNDVPIYDFQWSQSQINVTEAPANAEVDSITVTTNIDHSYVGDLWILFEAPDSTVCTLWDYNQYPAAGYQTITTDLLQGRDVNGRWRLWIHDGYAGDEGYLRDWNITIYYTLN